MCAGNTCVVNGDDACGFLPAVLQSIEAEVGRFSRIFDACYANNSTHRILSPS
jgi:hypothetical protein